MEIGPMDSSDIEQESEEDEIVCLDEESDVKKKAECMTFNQMYSLINLETLKKLLLFGVEATLKQSSRLVWPPVTKPQESLLRGTYQTMLATVPLVRELDKLMK